MKLKMMSSILIRKSQVTILVTLLVMIVIILNGCTTSNDALDNSNYNLGNQLSFSNSATIPVLNGAETKTGIYIRNNTGHTIQGVQYTIDDTESTTPAISLNGYQCNRIEPNSSCLLGFTTRSLKIGETDHAIVVAHYTVGDKQAQKSKQLINLNYVDTNKCTGINFSGQVNLFKREDYATAYAYTCSNQSFSNVGFYPLEKSVVVTGDISNGNITIEAGQVLPLEITTGQTITANNVEVVPFVKKELDISNLHNDYQLRNRLQQTVGNKSLLSGSGLLNVIISPTSQANLTMSDLSVMYDSTTSQTLTIFNNGSLTATDISLQLPTAVVEQSSTCSTTLAPGASCNYVVHLSDQITSNGSAIINLNYNNSQQTVTASQTVYYAVNKTEPMVYITPSTSSITMEVNESQNISFTLYNIGGQAVSANPSINLSQYGLSQATLTIESSTCSAGILVNASCTVSGKIVAGSNITNGKIFLRMLATSASGGNFSFVSLPVTIAINNSLPAISSITPANGDSNVNTSTAIQLAFNVPMNPVKLNIYNIQLIHTSDSQQISLNPGTVAPDNQSVIFTLPSGTKLNNYDTYSIVVNQVNIVSATGVAIGTNPAYVAATFTTGDWDAPQIINYQPYNGAILQSRNSTVRLTFNESMDVASLLEAGTVRLISVATGNEVPLTGSQWIVDSTGYSFYVDHVTFDSLSNYKLIIDQTKVRDASSNHVPIGSNESYTVSTFSTASFMNPTISSVSPTINETGVATSESLNINFSSQMNVSTLTNTNIKLKRVYDNTYITLTNPVYNYVNNMVSFTISGGLQSNTTYQVELTTANIKDQVYDLPLDVSGFNNNSSTYQFTTGGFNSAGFMFYGANSVLGSQFYGESVISFNYAGVQQFISVVRTASEEYLAFSTQANMIYRSESGINWFPQTMSAELLATQSSSGTRFKMLYCSVVADNCFLVGPSGKIYRSSDDGRSWSQVTSNTSLTLYTIACDNVTGQYCVAGGGDGTTGVVLYSEDYGQSWVANTSTSWKEIDAVTFVGASSRVLIGGKGIFGATSNIAIYYNTANGFGAYSSWTAVTSNQTSDIADIKCFSNTTCYFVNGNGSQGYRTTTANSTVSWATAGTVPSSSNKLYCNTSACFAMNSSAAIAKATNGGNFNSVVSSISQFNGYATYAISGDPANDNVVVFDSLGDVIRTTTGFTSGAYSLVRSAPAAPLSGTQLNSSNYLFIGCISNRCIATTANTGAQYALNYSSDYGISWTQAAGTSSSTSYSSMVMIESQIAIVNRGNATTIRTVNGGQSWVNVGTLAYNIPLMSCTPTKCVGLALGASTSTTYVSIDKGATWNTGQTLPIRASSLYCWQNSCIAGNSSSNTKTYKLTSIATATSWTASSNYSPSAVVSAISCAGNNCLASGRSSTSNIILKSSDGGTNWTTTTPTELNVAGSLSFANAVDLVCSGANCAITIGLGGNSTIMYYSNDFGISWYSPASGYSLSSISRVALWFD